MDSKQYVMVPESRGFVRTFEIVSGVNAGYTGHGGVSPEGHMLAERAIQNWQSDRIQAGKPFLTGMLQPSTVFYGWKEGDKAKVMKEAVLVFHGTVSHLYSSGIPDAEIEAQLNEIASALAGALNQTRVYVFFRDLQWVLQAKGKDTPTGEKA